jgi:hypothetical protein
MHRLLLCALMLFDQVLARLTGSLEMSLFR